MSWPKDDSKLNRVRALMKDQDVSALVVRAPDNVLYLTNYWCMKGYDVVVFPREGDPTLIALEPQLADAQRNSWTKDLKLFKGYDERDARPAPFRSLDLALETLKQRGLTDKVAVELNMGTQSADRMVGEPTTPTQFYLRRLSQSFWSGCGRDPLLSEARAIKTSQEIERMRLANELAALAMDYTREHMKPGMKESEVGGMYESFVHGLGVGYKGKVEMARAFTLVWSGKGIATFTATGDRPIQENEPTLFEIWVCVDGYWTDLTKNACPGTLTAPNIRNCSIFYCSVQRSGKLRARWSEFAGAGSSGPRANHRRRLSRAAFASDLSRGRRARARAALRSPGWNRHDQARNGPGDRAGHLLAGRRRTAAGRQFSDHRQRQRETLFRSRRFSSGVSALGRGSRTTLSTPTKARRTDLNPDLVQKILPQVKEDEIVAMSRDVINIPSPTGEELQMAQYMQSALQQLGLHVTWQEVEEARANVVGRWIGTGGGKNLMFNGHMDTSNTGREDFLTGLGYKPNAVVKDGFIYGLGIYNMKGALVCYTHAVKALQRAGVRLKGDVIIAAVAGEIEKTQWGEFKGKEYRGYGFGTHYLVNHGMLPDMCILGEPTDMHVVLEHFGSMWVRISCTGIYVHTAFCEGREEMNSIRRMHGLMEPILKWITTWEKQGVLRRQEGDRKSRRDSRRTCMAGQPDARKDGSFPRRTRPPDHSHERCAARGAAALSGTRKAASGFRTRV